MVEQEEEPSRSSVTKLRQRPSKASVAKYLEISLNEEIKGDEIN